MRVPVPCVPHLDVDEGEARPHRRSKEMSLLYCYYWFAPQGAVKIVRPGCTSHQLALFGTSWHQLAGPTARSSGRPATLAHGALAAQTRGRSAVWGGRALTFHFTHRSSLYLCCSYVSGAHCVTLWARSTCAAHDTNVTPASRVPRLAYTTVSSCRSSLSYTWAQELNSSPPSQQGEASRPQARHQSTL